MTDQAYPREPGPAGRGGTRRGWAVWGAGLVVVIAAGAATAHGLYVVALGSGTPAGIAWLYPVITDGLALVAYAATARLGAGGRRYAWTVVVVAAGLSGLAQATYLAGALPPAAPAPGALGEVAAAPPVLRFGVGAWPAIAAAIAAHLLALIGAHYHDHDRAHPERAEADAAVERGQGDSDVPARLGGVPSADVPAVPSAAVPPVPSGAVPPAALHAAPQAISTEPEPVAEGASGSRDGVSQAARAREVARALAGRSGELPTVRELAETAGVGRGTAGRVVAALRADATTADPALDPAQGAFWEPDRT